MVKIKGPPSSLAQPHLLRRKYLWCLEMPQERCQAQAAQAVQAAQAAGPLSPPPCIGVSQHGMRILPSTQGRQHCPGCKVITSHKT